MVLYAASHLPERHRVPHEASWRRGWAFLQKGIDAQGRVAAPDGTADYPTYATAMTLTAIRRFGWQDVPAADLERMKRYLLDSQLTEKQGWTRDDPCYGGWDHIGHTPGAKRLSTGADISVTRFAVEALAACGMTQEEPELFKAICFSGKCATEIGEGFCFTPDLSSGANKAGWWDQKRQQPKPYGTATVDGMLIGGPRPANLDRWRCWNALLGRQAIDRVPGFMEGDGWSKGLRYYYWAGVGKVLEEVVIPEEEKGHESIALDAHRRGLRDVVLKEQRPDGSWASENARMREDDPLVATSFALIALGTDVR